MRHSSFSFTVAIMYITIVKQPNRLRHLLYSIDWIIIQLWNGLSRGCGWYLGVDNWKSGAQVNLCINTFTCGDLRVVGLITLCSGFPWRVFQGPGSGNYQSLKTCAWKWHSTTLRHSFRQTSHTNQPRFQDRNLCSSFINYTYLLTKY